MMETWKSLPSFEGRYEVSDHGNVRSVDRQEWLTGRHPTPHLRTRKGKVLKLHKGKNGYVSVHIYDNGKNRFVSVHRLVGLAFIDNPDNLPEINHKDKDKHNNHVSNLEWTTRSGNMRHAYEVPY